MATKTVSVRAYVKVRGKDEYRQRTPAELREAARRQAEAMELREARRRQRVIDDMLTAATKEDLSQ